MKGPVRPASPEAGLAFSGVAILGAMLVFAPLIKGGNRPLPLLILELTAIVLLFLLLLRPGFGQHLSRPLLVALGALIALPLVQLLPLPEFLWNWLPGRALYADALTAVGRAPNYRTLSLIPGATESALLVLLVPLTVFLATVSTSQAQLRQLINLFIGLAVLQAVIGLAQFGTGSLTVFWPPAEGKIGSAYGTYPNYDHFAGFLEMALPLALALIIAHIDIGSHKPPRSQRRQNFRQRLAQLFASGIRFNAVAIYAGAALAILLGLIFSRSRTAIALVMLGILLCALIFGSRVGGQRSTRLVTLFTVIGFALALEIGLAPVLTRFADGGLVDYTRLSIFAGTIQGIREFFPFGSGLGTYPAVFRGFQPGDVPYFVNHAHNDYLEWLFEGGLAIAILLLAFLLLYILRWREIWPSGEERWAPIAFVRIAAGISLLLIGLHGLIDFNLHIPANALFFAFVAGIFFHPGSGSRSPELQVMAPPAKSKPNPVPLPVAPQAPLDVRNPFAD
jgi:O-antigen ligase